MVMCGDMGRFSRLFLSQNLFISSFAVVPMGTALVNRASERTDVCIHYTTHTHTHSHTHTHRHTHTHTHTHTGAHLLACLEHIVDYCMHCLNVNLYSPS